MTSLGERLGAASKRLAIALPGDHWKQVIIWSSTTAVFPVLVFVGYVMAGRSWDNQIGEGQLLLVATTLTAPIIGVLALPKKSQSWPRVMLFVAALTHVSLTAFYFAPVAGDETVQHVVRNSFWLYFAAVVLGVGAVLLVARDES